MLHWPARNSSRTGAILYASRMSTAEIKTSIERMTEDERFFASAYLHHLARANDPTYQSLLGHRMQRMDDGKKLTLKQATHVHRELEAERL